MDFITPLYRGKIENGLFYHNDELIKCDEFIFQDVDDQYYRIVFSKSNKIANISGVFHDKTDNTLLIAFNGKVIRI